MLYSRCVGKAEWDSYSVFGGVTCKFQRKNAFRGSPQKRKYNLKIEKMRGRSILTSCTGKTARKLKKLLDEMGEKEETA